MTAHPTIVWVIQQLREAMPFGRQPTYLFRDNDAIYGDELGRFLVGTGIEQVKTAHRSPWQNSFVERYGGTLRRELLDHVIVLNEGHLKRLLKESIEEYYHLARPHQGLNGDTCGPQNSCKTFSDRGNMRYMQIIQIAAPVKTAEVSTPKRRRCQVFYSSRSASNGSTRVARRAGM